MNSHYETTSYINRNEKMYYNLAYTYFLNALFAILHMTGMMVIYLR
jgi:hypothetical protein